MRTTIKLTGIIAWAMVLGLLFAACGDNGDPSSPTHAPMGRMDGNKPRHLYNSGCGNKNLFP
jgi:hypothetical protein